MLIINFLPHLSTKCSVLSELLRLLPVVRQCASTCVRKPFDLNNFSSETTHQILTKLHRNDPQVFLYQSCSKHFRLLHKQVMMSKNRFSKCNFQKSSCPKLQGPELSYLVYGIIQRSSSKVAQIVPLGSKLIMTRGSRLCLPPPLRETYCFCLVRLSVCPSVTLCFRSITRVPFDPEPLNFIG